MGCWGSKVQILLSRPFLSKVDSLLLRNNFSEYFLPQQISLLIHCEPTAESSLSLSRTPAKLLPVLEEPCVSQALSNCSLSGSVTGNQVTVCGNVIGKQGA